MSWGSEPDTSGADAAAKAQSDLAREQWETYKNEWAPMLKEQMQQQADLGRGSYNLAKEQQEYQLGLSRKYDDRFWNTQVPLEDKIRGEAQNYDTDAERERMAGEARGDVEQGFSSAEQSMRRDMGRMGLNPADPASYSMRREMGADKALAIASAMNKTRHAAKEMGWAKRMDAAALGRNLPGFSGQSTQLAMGWGGQRSAAGSSTFNNTLAGLNAMNQSAGGAGQNYQGSGNTYGVGLNAKNEYGKQQGEMMGSGVGAVAGIAAAVIV